MNNETALTVEITIKAALERGLQEARGLKVIDQESADRAGVIAANLKAGLKRWEEWFREPKAKAKATHSILCDREGEILKMVKPVIAHLGEQASAWIYAEREKFRKAQEERERKEWEANQKAREAESKLEGVTGFEEAEAIVEEAQPAEPLPPAPVKPTVEAAQFRDHWVFKVEDLGKVPLRFLMIDEKAVNEYIRETKDKASLSVPGLKFVNEPIMATRRSI